MKNSIIIRITLLLFSTLLFFGCASEKQKTIETGKQSTLSETLNKAIDTNIEDNEAGLIITVWQNGQILYTGMKGLAKKGSNIDEDTGFRLASVSKTFTAMGVLSLYEQGIINLDDSVLDYLPELDESWRPIDIHQLLSHQSGIPDFANDFNMANILPNGTTNQDILGYFIENPELEFNPATDADYSNTGYVLLAEVISRVTSSSFSQFMQENVFVKSGMNNTYLIDEKADIRDNAAMNHAKNHHIFGRDFFATGSASQVSSMRDMQVFITEYLKGNILQPNTQELMLELHSNAIFNGYGYGIGYFDSSFNVYGHTGGNDGFRTMFVVNKEKNAAIIILGNGGDNLPDFNYLIELAGEFIE
jgi:CubicO group peptidase (beta-lactamase class C family)